MKSSPLILSDRLEVRPEAAWIEPLPIALEPELIRPEVEVQLDRQFGQLVAEGVACPGSYAARG